MEKDSDLFWGCTCSKCIETQRKAIEAAREDWRNGERNISLRAWHNSCADGCCDDYGTDFTINGFKTSADGENIESVLKTIFTFLEIDNVNTEYDYDY